MTRFSGSFILEPIKSLRPYLQRSKYITQNCKQIYSLLTNIDPTRRKQVQCICRKAVLAAAVDHQLQKSLQEGNRRPTPFSSFSKSVLHFALRRSYLKTSFPYLSSPKGLWRLKGIHYVSEFSDSGLPNLTQFQSSSGT